MQRMKENNIYLRPFFYPLISEPANSALPASHTALKRSAVSYRIFYYGINPPCGMDMTHEWVNFVCDVLKKEVGSE
jgi:hypothetical protein